MAGRWALSNFHEIPGGITGFGSDERVYRTVEAAYQAAKTTSDEWRDRIQAAPTPGAAKRLGRQAPLRQEWHTDWGERAYSVVVMEDLLVKKFAKEPHRARLLATEGELVEWNTWHDIIWGQCVCAKHRGTGHNWLGRLLMGIRQQIQQEVADVELVPDAPGRA